MSLQFVDFDADGRRDLLTATYEGTVFLTRGTSNGWAKPQHVLDAQGRPVLLSLYYDMQENTYKNAERSPAGTTNAEDHCVSVTAVDWDADGDLDLLLGAYEGRLYLQKNVGNAKQPCFEGTNHLLQAGGKPLDLEGGLTAARTVDWNGDGLFDLVCGAFDGGALLYLNTGKPDAPVFAAPIELLKSGEGASVEQPAPRKGWYVDALDYDGDGDLDLLVGGSYEFVPPVRVLTAAEQERLAALDELAAQNEVHFRDLQETFASRAAGLDSKEVGAAYKAFFDEPEQVEFMDARLKVLREIGVLRPREKTLSGVWLYRQE